MVWMLLAGCERWEGVDDTAPADVDTDTDVDADSDTDADTDTDTSTVAPWVVEVARDDSTYGEIGVSIVTYRITEDNPTGYRDPDGGDPRFHVIAPDTLAGSGPRPLLMWLHGSAQGIEGDVDYGQRCGADGIAPIVSDALTEHAFVAAAAAERDWIWVVPENSWCDLWTGLGAADPVDTAHHGAEHVQTVLGVMLDGLDGVQADPARLMGWGTSIGGSGIVTNSALAGGFQRVIVDSGPSDPIGWYSLPNEQVFLDHIFGGPPTDDTGAPTEFYANYARADATELIGAGYRVPLFVAYNYYDTLVPFRQNEALATSLEIYDTEAVPYFIHDYRHHAPANSFHVQTGYERPPFGYTTAAAFAFLDGGNVAFFEAEDTCPRTCTVEREAGTGELEATSAFSGGAAVVTTAEDGATDMYAGEVPDDVARGEATVVFPVIQASNLGSVADGTTVLTLELRRDGEALSTMRLSKGDFAEDTGSHADFYAQVANTAWVIDTDGDGDSDPLPTGVLTFVVSSHGVGDFYLDGFWVIGTP